MIDTPVSRFFFDKVLKMLLVWLTSAWFTFQLPLLRVISFNVGVTYVDTRKCLVSKEQGALKQRGHSELTWVERDWRHKLDPESRCKTRKMSWSITPAFLHMAYCRSGHCITLLLKYRTFALIIAAQIYKLTNGDTCFNRRWTLSGLLCVHWWAAFLQARERW